MTDNNTERDAFIELLNVYDSTMRNLLTFKSIRTQEQKDGARLAIIDAFEARATSPAPIGDSGASDVPSKEELELFARDLDRAGQVGFAGYRIDENDRYTIPVINPNFYDFILEVLKRYAPDSRALASANSASDALPARNAGLTDWRHRCAVLIDIYDDGTKNAPEDRSYVEGAFTAEIDEVRALLAAPEALPQAAPVATPIYELSVKIGNREYWMQVSEGVHKAHTLRKRIVYTAATASEPIARDVLTKLDAALNYPSGQLKVCSSIEDGKTVFVVVRTIPLKSILITDLGKRFASRSLAEAALLELAGEPVPIGTFACPICGKDSPHEHSSAEVAQHRIDQRAIIEAAREGKSQ